MKHLQQDNMDEKILLHNITTSNEKSFFLQVSPKLRLVSGSLLLCSLLFGSFMKSILYSYLKDCKVVAKPINFFILLIQSIHHALHIFICLHALIVLLLGMSPIEFVRAYLVAEMNPTNYCTAMYFLGVFNTTNWIIGNSFLGMFRLLYLTSATLSTMLLGNNFFLGLVVCINLSISSVIAGFFVHEKSSTRAMFNLCVGHSQKFQVRLLLPLPFIKAILCF